MHLLLWWIHFCARAEWISIKYYATLLVPLLIVGGVAMLLRLNVLRLVTVGMFVYTVIEKYRAVFELWKATWPDKNFEHPMWIFFVEGYGTYLLDFLHLLLLAAVFMLAFGPFGAGLEDDVDSKDGIVEKPKGSV